MRLGDILVTLDPSRTGRARMRIGVELAARAHARMIGYYVGPTAGMYADTSKHGSLVGRRRGSGYRRSGERNR